MTDGVPVGFFIGLYGFELFGVLAVRCLFPPFWQGLNPA
jgi:hypothetical protein